jgi:GTP-binding protein EngB required for normal cell division
MAPNLGQKGHDGSASMILLMGSTGAGKSYFINSLKEGATIESDSLYSCSFSIILVGVFSMTNETSGTATCQVVGTRIGKTNVAVVDCPGFNDTTRSDTEILNEIAKVLSSQYLLSKKLRLRAILYLRDITKMKMEGSDVRTLNLFSRLVGKNAFPHVVFVTTMWGKLDENGLKHAYKREMELKEKFWREMILEGSTVQRFDGTRASAEGIVSQLVGVANPVVLQIQHELIDREMALAATAAGAVLVPEVEEKLGDSKSKLQRFRDRLAREKNGTVQKRVMLDIQQAEKERDQAQVDQNRLQEKVGVDMKAKVRRAGDWQDALRTICAVVGVSVTIIASVLPLAGVSCALM